MARLHGSAGGRENDPVGTAQRMTHLEKALTGRLRNLDIACAWEEGTVALLLPATGSAGGGIVADRIEATFTTTAREMDHDITIVVATAQKGFTDLQVMLTASQEDLNRSDARRIQVSSAVQEMPPRLSGMTTAISSTIGSSEFLVIDDDGKLIGSSSSTSSSSNTHGSHGA